MTVHWRKETIDGYETWTGASPQLSVSIVPELGSKAVSLRSTMTGREWLWRSGKKLGNGGYGSRFADSDESGWDEMFPGIDTSRYPSGPWSGRVVPDHGEVWSLPWKAAGSGTALHCIVEGAAFPYLLEKIYSFTPEGILRIDYRVSNLSSAPLAFLWAAHPLLEVRPGMKLQVPDGMDEIEVSYSGGERLGTFGSKQAWPLVHTKDGTIDLSEMEENEGLHAEKYYFTGKVQEGFAAVSDPGTGETLAFRFPAEQVPYLAIWANYGGFGGNYQLAIEPATGRMDSLAEAVRRDEVAVVAGEGEYCWHLEVSLT